MPHFQNDKDTKVFVPKPEPYKGQFVTKISDFYYQLRKLKPDYEFLDPRTWPCVTAVQLEAASLGGPHYGRSTPLGIAYDAGCTEELVNFDALTQHIKSWTSCREKGHLHTRFFHYPYNFDQDGEPRARVEIPEDDFEAWMESVNGPDWALAYPPLEGCERPAVRESSETPQKAPDTPSHEQVAVAARITPENPKEKLQEELLCPRSDAQDHNKEIENLRAQLQRERQRADKAEQEAREWKEHAHRERARADEEKVRADGEKARADKKDATLFRKSAELRQLRRHLEAGTEMHGGAKALKRKRNNGDDDSGSSKKTKKTT